MAAPSWSRLALAALLALPCVTAARPSDAQPAATAPRRAVSVVIKGSAEEGRVLAATILELLARLQLTMVDGESRSPVLATVEIDLAGPEGAHVLVRSGSGEPRLDRRVRDANAAIQREQIAHAVRGAAEAELLADDDRSAGRSPPGPPAPGGSTPPSPAPPPPAPDPSPRAESPAPEPPPRASSDVAVDRDTSTSTTVRSPSALALDVATVVGGGPVASSAGPVMRVGGSAALAYRRGLRPSLALSALYAFPFDAGTDTLSSRTKLVSTRAMAALEILRGRWFTLDLGGGGGVDVLSVAPASTVLPGSALRDAQTRVDPILSVGATGRFAIASDVTLMLGVVSDFDLASRQYVFDDRGQRGVVLEPWTLRPMVLAGLSFTAFGEVPFQPRGSR
jgi:hypothetical protein